MTDGATPIATALPVRVIDDIVWRGACAVPSCDWESGPWASRDEAEAMATWHFFEVHPLTWLAYRGDVAPVEPDPREAFRG